MSNYLKGKRCMVWAFMQNARMYEAFEKYGDRLDTVGIFTFEVDSTGTITETGTPIANMMPYINKWPHIKWMLTVMNHGYASIFTALRNNTSGAKTKFLSELVRIIQKYPWCAGVDIDLEQGGGYENRQAANELFRDIYSTVKNHNRAKLVNICLPGMTGVQGSVGGENWCVYADLNPYCDTAAIMSYGMAWAGSAPGPVSPRSWLEGIYSYAIQVMTPSKLYLGFPAYGWEWQIFQRPEDIGKTYRGTSNTYYAAEIWMKGGYNYADRQQYIPFVSYWDDYDKGPYILPFVYDYVEGQDSVSRTGPLIGDTYNRRRYLTCYGKEQVSSFGTIYVDRDGKPDNYTGNMIIGDTTAAVAEDGTATYNFNVPSSGVYDVAVRIGFPFWDKNGINLTLDGSPVSFNENRMWWPYWRRTYWTALAMRRTLSAGQHSIVITGGVPGSVFYGFRVCSSFSQECAAGSASYSLKPRHFKDVNGQMRAPADGFRLTTEMLRRKPDSALAWYEDFRDQPPLQDSYWTTLSGNWEVWRDPDDWVSNRPNCQLEGSGQLAWKYNGFSDVHLRARLAFPSNGTGRAGVFLGNLFCCINISNQRVELYQGSTLLGSWQGEYSRTSDANIRSNPNMYLVEMRKRGNRVRVYSGSSNVLRFTANISATSGYCGFQSDGPVKCELLRLGDAWTYEPYEAFDVHMPDGTAKSYGRIARSGVAWDNEFQVFTLSSDVEELSTRSEEISMDYDFYHSDVIRVVCGGDYIASVIPRDINVWISRLFFGDSDGFCVVYYQDVDSMVYWANEAAYRWGLRGVAIWSLGQEDMRLWEHMPKQV